MEVATERFFKIGHRGCLILKVFKKIKAAWAFTRFSLKGYRAKTLPDLRDECADLLDILGVSVHIRGSLPPGPNLIVANHLSYLDVPILGLLAPMRFITSYEVRDDGVTGSIAKFGHSLFVERRNYSTLIKDIHAIADCLALGENVALFPEATTTCGRMLPWRSSLLQAAMRVPNVKVVPVAIQYLEINGEPVTADNHDSIYYYGGDMIFKDHFARLFDLKKIKVRLTILPPVQGKSRKDLTRRARQAVALQLG